MFRRFATRLSLVCSTVDDATALNRPTASIASASFARCAASTAKACGIVVSALSTVRWFAAT